jgi:hypothetical protein
MIPNTKQTPNSLELASVPNQQPAASSQHGIFQTDFGVLHGSNGQYLLKLGSISLLWIHP